MELLTRANFRLIIGNFEVDLGDGEIRFKTSLDVEGDRLSPALANRLVTTNVSTMDEYLPAILAVVSGVVGTADALALVEAEHGENVADGAPAEEPTLREDSID